MFLTAAVIASTVVASTAVASSTTNSTQTVNDIEPGVLGFLVVAAIAVALVFLLRSMNKQFRKIGPKPDDDALPDGTVSGEVVSREDAKPTADADAPD